GVTTRSGESLLSRLRYPRRKHSRREGMNPLLGIMMAFCLQQNDTTQFPNPEGAGIKKTLAHQIGGGQGDAVTPDTSLFLIARDPFRAIRRGRQLFQRKFT